MLESVVGLDMFARVRELELAVTRRLRESLRPYVNDPDSLEQATREALIVARDFAGSFQAVSDRVRVRRETERE